MFVTDILSALRPNQPSPPNAPGADGRLFEQEWEEAAAEQKDATSTNTEALSSEIEAANDADPDESAAAPRADQQKDSEAAQSADKDTAEDFPIVLTETHADLNSAEGEATKRSQADQDTSAKDVDSLSKSPEIGSKTVSNKTEIGIPSGAEVALRRQADQPTETADKYLTGGTSGSVLAVKAALAESNTQNLAEQTTSGTIEFSLPGAPASGSALVGQNVDAAVDPLHPVAKNGLTSRPDVIARESAEQSINAGLKSEVDLTGDRVSGTVKLAAEEELLSETAHVAGGRAKTAVAETDVLGELKPKVESVQGKSGDETPKLPRGSLDGFASASLQPNASAAQASASLMPDLASILGGQDGGQIGNLPPGLVPLDGTVSHALTSTVSATPQFSAPPQTLMPQAASQMAVALASAENGATEIALNPEELGRVRLTLSSGDGPLTISISAERPETMDLMRRHLDALAKEFREMGFGDVSFDFQQQSDRAETGSNHAENTETAATQTPDQPDPVNAARPPVLLRTGLDLKL